jgi:hypothetical protein
MKELLQQIDFPHFLYEKGDDIIGDWRFPPISTYMSPFSIGDWREIIGD